ncbi:MAG: hypothetical protein HQL53_09900 [Magnetococcales bacterium]|nr:hypothetical protein [Magnetococcales bacterium]
MTIEMKHLTLEHFQKAINETFSLTANIGEETKTLAFTLEEVTERQKCEGAPCIRQPFSLLFLGPDGVYIPQGMYAIEHEAVGTQEVFLVPVGQRGQPLNAQHLASDAPVEYEAIFN